MNNTTPRYGAWGVERGLKAESWMACLRKYAGDFLRRSREALEAGFIHLASTCPVTWRCWMRHVSLHPSSFALPPWLRPRSNGHRRMPRQNHLRPSPRSRRKICRHAMGQEGDESFDHLVGEPPIRATCKSTAVRFSTKGVLIV